MITQSKQDKLSDALYLLILLQMARDDKFHYFYLTREEVDRFLVQQVLIQRDLFFKHNLIPQEEEVLNLFR